MLGKNDYVLVLGTGMYDGLEEGAPSTQTEMSSTIVLAGLLVREEEEGWCPPLELPGW